jgi:hypothetical protein
MTGAEASTAAETTPTEAIVGVASGEAAAVRAEFAAAADHEIPSEDAAESTADESEPTPGSLAGIAAAVEPVEPAPAPPGGGVAVEVELAEVVPVDVAKIGEAPVAVPLVAAANDDIPRAAETSPAEDSSAKAADLDGAAPHEVTAGAALAASQEAIDEEAEVAEAGVPGGAAPAVEQAPTTADPVAASENGGSDEHVAAAAPLTATVVIPARPMDADISVPPPEQTAGIAAQSA